MVLKRLAFALVLVPVIAEAQDHPRFFITTAREAAWARMKRDYEANRSAPATTGGRMYKLIKTSADSGARYSDIGTWGTWMYHVTRDSTYATKAWTKISAGFLGKAETCNNSGLSGNFSRENFIQHVWMYDWLHPALTSQQRIEYQNKINAMAGCVGNNRFQRGYDSDQTTGDYMGIAMWHLATGGYNPTAATIWNDAARKIGGLASTGSNYDTYRNSIYRYVTQLSAGGEWLEGYEYSRGGTIKLLLLGVDAVNTWTRTDNFPEVTAWKEQAALQYIHTLTPNSGSGAVLQPYLWGDTQSARQYRAFYYETALVLAGAVEGTVTGPVMQDWVMDREEASGLKALDPYPRGFLMFNPYATRGDYTTMDTTKYVSGVQMLNSRTGWGASDSWFMSHFAATPGADHAPTYWGEFQLWKNGAWAITHPQCYGGTCIDSRGTNGLSFAGVPVGNSYGPREFRGAIVNRTETAPVSFTYIAGTMGGDLWGAHRYGGCPSYIMEHTRSLVWLRDWDVVVVFDRANSKGTTFPTATLNASFRAWSESRPGKELYIHTAVRPTQAANYTDWIYDAASSHTRVTHLLPASSTRTIEDETTLYSSYFNVGTIRASEKRFHVRIVPTETNQWEPFLNVWDAYARGTPSTVTLVDDATNKAHGALIARGSTSVLALFNGIQGPDLPGPVPVKGGYWDWATSGPTTSTILSSVRLRARGYTVTFDAGRNATQALLFDLNPAAEWTVTVNGGAARALAVGADGVAIAQIATTGSTTLVIKATGTDRR